MVKSCLAADFPQMTHAKASAVHECAQLSWTQGVFLDFVKVLYKGGDPIIRYAQACPVKFLLVGSV